MYAIAFDLVVAASPKISLRLEPPGMKGPAPTPR
jgi:hypothetical protein